jgi:hypothetical protein
LIAYQAAEYKTNRPAFNAKAKEWTRCHAIDALPEVHVAWRHR